MKTVFVISAILLATVCATICHADPIAEKEAEILDLMATIPSNLTCGVGEPWYIFAYQRHEYLTLGALVNLSKSASDEKFRYLALDSLSHQKNVRLIPFWQGILENRDKLDDRSISIAISGLGTINIPQSHRILHSLLSDPETPPKMLARACFEYQKTGYAPKEVFDQLVTLTTHESDRVRLAAFESIYYTQIPARAEALKSQLLGRALADTNLGIVRLGLRSLVTNPSPELFPIMLDYLNHTDASVRASADGALGSLLLDSENFEMFRKAFWEKRWTYQTAPLLTFRYARILEESRGEFAEAEKAYQSYTLNDGLGATMLYRLIQVKQKRGDIEGAIAVLNRIVKEYPQNTRIDADDFPAPGHNIIGTVGELEREFRVILEDAPIRIRVSSLNKTYHPKENLKFKVSIHNITTENVMLHCKHQKGKNVLVPDRPIIVINGNWWADFHETTGLIDTVKKVTIPPNESYSYIGTRYPFRTGNYVIDFRFKPVCEFEDGTQWSARILSNSVKITMP